MVTSELLTKLGVRILTVLSALGLAWFCHQSLAASWFRPATASHRWTIRAANPDEHHPEAKGADTWIRTLTHQGTRIWPEQVELTGKWQVEGAPISPVYIHRNNTGPAELSFTATDAAIRFFASQWSGRATVLRNGEVEQTAELFTRRGGDRSAYVDLPRFDVPWWSLPAHVLACLLALLALRPWLSQRRLDVWCTAYMLALHVLVWATHPVGGNSDSTGYLGCVAANVAGLPAYFPPGYSFFLEALHGVPRLGLGGAATLLQHAMMAASLLMLMAVLRRYTPAALTSAWLLVTATMYPILYLPQALMSETLALFGMTSAVWLALRAAETGSIWRDALAGLLLGVAALTRVVPLATLPALWLAAIAARSGRPAWRRWTLSAAAAIAITALPVLWFGAHSGIFKLTGSDGIHLFNRVVYEQKILDERGEATRKILEHVPRDELVTMCHWDVRPALIKRAGIDDAAAWQLASRAAYEAILAHPLDYFLFSFPVACRNLFSDPSPMIALDAHYDARTPALETPTPLPCGARSLELNDQLRRAFAVIWPPIPWLVVVGMVLAGFLRARWLALGVAAVPLGYLLATGFVEFFFERYVVGVMPFVTAGAMTPLAALADALARRKRASEPPAAP